MRADLQSATKYFNRIYSMWVIRGEVKRRSRDAQSNHYTKIYQTPASHKTHKQSPKKRFSPQKNRMVQSKQMVNPAFSLFFIGLPLQHLQPFFLVQLLYCSRFSISFLVRILSLFFAMESFGRSFKLGF